jgi:hypothetical protein
MIYEASSSINKLRAYLYAQAAQIKWTTACYLWGKVDKSYDEKLIHTIRGVGDVLKKNS